MRRLVFRVLTLTMVMKLASFFEVHDPPAVPPVPAPPSPSLQQPDEPA
jgi:hypothetical protein